MNELLGILFMLAFVTLFGVGMIVLVSVLGKIGNRSAPKQSDVKRELYECGVIGQAPGSGKMPIKFYLTAILFILFDIEVIFLYPWAITYREFLEAGHGAYIFSAMFIFLFVFTLGLIWEIKSRALEWE